MTMTARDLDLMVESCDSDIRRLTKELNDRLDDAEKIRALLKDAIHNRYVWLNHPDRPDSKDTPRERACFG